MIGADRYASLIPTGQYGRLYCVSSEHARGKTFCVFVLPAGEEAKPNGPNNPPLNSGAVEVFGITGGPPGWTEEYGWLHKGPWQSDVEKLATSFELARKAKEKRTAALEASAEERRRVCDRQVLDRYPVDGGLGSATT